MRKTLPFVFFVLLTIGAFAIGFASSWLWQSPKREALADALTQTQSDLQAERVAISSLTVEKQSLTEDLEAQEENIKVLSALNDQLKTKAQETSKEVERLSGALDTAKTSLENQESALDAANKNIETKIASALTAQQEIANDQLNAKEQELETMKEALASMQQKQGSANEELAAQIRQAEANIASLTESLREKEAQIQETERSQKSLQAQLDQSIQSFKELEAESAQGSEAKNDELVALREQLETAQKTAIDSEKAMAEMVAAFEAAQISEPNEETAVEQETQSQTLAALAESQSALKSAQEQVVSAKREASDLAEVFEQQAEMLSRLEDEASAYKTQLQSANDEADFLYGEVERYTEQSRLAFQALASDLGGIDVLLTPEFKSNFADFLGDIGIQ